MILSFLNFLIPGKYSVEKFLQSGLYDRVFLNTFNCTLILVFFLFPPLARAFNFYPSAISIDSTGTIPPPVFTISNGDNVQHAIQIKINLRKIDEHGKEQLIESEEIKNLFVVYPAQFILEANQQRQIRVYWKGEKRPASELNYRIIAEELPIELNQSPKGTKGQIKMLLRYISSVYITPPDGKEKLVVQEISPFTKGGKDFLSFKIENVGSKHLIFENLRFYFQGQDSKGKNSEITIPVEEIPTVLGQNILSQHARYFIIPWPAPLDKKKNPTPKIDIRF